MVESHNLLTDLKATDEEAPSVVHHLGSIEMWKNPNDDDDPEYEEDWYSSDTQESFLDFDEEYQLSITMHSVESAGAPLLPLACLQYDNITFMLESTSLQVGTLKELSAELDKLEVRTSVEISPKHVHDMAKEVLHESREPPEHVQDDHRLQIATWKEIGRATTELNKLRSEEFLAKFGNIRSHFFLAPTAQEINTHVPEVLSEGDLAQPWSQDFQDDEAPEDVDTPQPSNFGVPLAYMNKTLAEATTDFFHMIITRVSDELSSVTNVVENLKAKNLPVFVPQNWLGITGIPPVVIFHYFGSLKLDQSTPRC